MNTVEETVRNYYNEHSLDDASVERILKMGKQRHRFQMFYRVAAVLVLCVGSLLGFMQYQYADTLNKTVAQIKMNHLKGELPSIVSNDYREVSQNLNKLAFAVAETPELKNYELLGGLYCKVQGNKAAQLKFLTADQDTATLYVCESKGSIEKLRKETKVRDGVKVTIWQDNDLFYGMAENVK